MGGLIRLSPLNSKNIEAMRTKLGREMVRPKMFPMRLANELMTSYNVGVTSYSKTAAILVSPSWIY